MKAAVAAEDEVISPLFEFRNNGLPVGNGWTSPSNGARWGFDYLSRTATAKSNMYDNAPSTMRDNYAGFDTGKRLNSRRLLDPAASRAGQVRSDQPKASAGSGAGRGAEESESQ